MGEEALDELNFHGHTLNNYIAMTKDDPKRQKGRNLALKKKWGDKKFGLPEPKVKAVDRLKEENLEELSRTTLRKYKAKAIDYVGQAMDGKKGKEGISKLDNRVGGIEAANKRLGVKYEETQIDEKLTKKMSAADVIHDFVHSDDPKFAGKSTKERQKMALGAYYGMRKKKVDEAQLDELHGKGDIEKIAAARHKKIMTSRATVPDNKNPHFPAHDRAVILKHMRTSKEVSKEAGKKKDINYPTYKSLSKAAREEQKKRENLEETSEKLRIAYTNKAMRSEEHTSELQSH